MTARGKPLKIRQEGRVVEALLVLMKHLTAHARWVFAILLVIYALSGIRTIESHEQALVLRFGNLQPDVHGPGLFMGLPEPFDRVLRFETGKETALALDKWAATGTKIGGPDRAVVAAPAPIANPLGIPIQPADPNTIPTAGSSMPEPGGSLDPVQQGYTLTTDYNLVQGRFVLRYRIENPFHFTVAGERTGPLLESLAYQALAARLAVRPIDASLTSDRRDLASEAMSQVQREADRLRLGVRISGLEIVELSPPSQVLAAFEDVVTAKQFAKTLYEGSRQYQTETLAKAGSDASVILRKAEGDASAAVSEATGEASAFSSMLVRYQRDPELVSRRLLYETLDVVMKRTQSRTLVPVDQARPSLLLEPLPADGR